MQSLENSAFAKEVYRAAQAAEKQQPPDRSPKPLLDRKKLAFLEAALQELQAIQREDTGLAGEEPAQGSSPSQADGDFKYVYDTSTRNYHKLMESGDYVVLGRNDVINHLAREGYSKYPPKGLDLSEADEFIIDLQSNHYVSYAGKLAGYKKGVLKTGGSRILITSEPTFIQPVEGEWSLLKGVLEKMFGDEQLQYVYGWLKVALEMFFSGLWMGGQVLALCGPPLSGKNLFAIIVQHLFGGREPGKPYSFMTGETPFNSDLMECELLTIEDEFSKTSFGARQAFGAKIKQQAVNRTHRLHRKGIDALTVVPLQRLIISLNDDPDSLTVLPPIHGNIADKIMLLRVYKHPMPRPTDTSQQNDAFEKELVAQLPAFVAFLLAWEIPEHLRFPRCGIKHYHHPDLLDALQVQTPEATLMQLVDDIIFAVGKPQKAWSGFAQNLLRQLSETKDRLFQKDIERILHNGQVCGRYLGRLATECPERVSKRQGGGGLLRWTILPPSRDPESEAVEVDSASLPLSDDHAKKMADAQTLLKKMADQRARNAQRDLFNS